MVAGRGEGVEAEGVGVEGDRFRNVVVASDLMLYNESMCMYVILYVIPLFLGLLYSAIRS